MKKSNPENLSLTRPVVIIGMMGAGKTTIGKKLATLMGVAFFDADKEIESVAGCKVADIFEKHGEKEFRRIERQVIARLLEMDTCVLSLGGGAFMDEGTRETIKRKAFSVWLKVEPAILLARVMRHGERPLLKDGNPEEKLKSLLAEREPIYQQANLTVLCDDRPVVQTAQRVYEMLLENPIA